MTSDQATQPAPIRLFLAAIVVDVDTGTEAHVWHETAEHTALLEWLAFHHLEPGRIPSGYRIERHASRCLISYVRIRLDDQGRRMRSDDPGDLDPFWKTEAAVEQGEAPPLPFPEPIARWLR